MTDAIEISDLEVSCIVGVFPSERGTAQPLLVDLDLDVDTRDAAVREDLHATVDYGRLAGDVRFLLERCRFSLLETAAEVIARYLLLPGAAARPPVTRARVRLRKPRALVGNAVAGVRIERTHADLATRVGREERAWGASELVFLGRDCAVERRTIARATTPFTHAQGESHELVVTEGARVNDALVAMGSAFTFHAGDARRYDVDSDVARDTVSAQPSLVRVLVVRRPAELADVIAPTDAPLAPARATLYVPPGAMATTRARRR